MEQNYQIDSIKAAQSDMRNAYRNGATGVLVSGLVWLTTGFVFYNFSPRQAIWALLIGGAFIHPVTLIVNRITGLNMSTNKDNKLVSLAMEGTIFMLMTIPVAYGLTELRTEWFFQGMLLIIGGRYLTFHTLYGTKLFWLLGGLLGLAAYGLFAFNTQPLITVLTGGLIEVIFSVVLFYDISSKKKAESMALSS
ncbi:hypothetical protein BH09BAC4_BH09BAC4_02380 [soil metagenome]